MKLKTYETARLQYSNKIYYFAERAISQKILMNINK